MPPSEREPLPTDTYRQSAEQLLDVLVANQSARQSRYFTASWDPQDPTRITNIAVATATPTGARRQNRFGLFRSAQFNLAVENDDGQTSQQFVWCRTEPQRPGAPALLDQEALAADYNYHTLHETNAVATLLDHCSSMEHYLTLLDTMREHGLVINPATLTPKANHLIYQAVYGNATRAQPILFDATTLFRFITTLQTFDVTLPREAQGFLTSQLLRTISRTHTTKTPEVREGAQKAATIMETALAQGVLPDEPRITNRIFSNSATYAFPFVTDLMHAKLQTDPNYGTDLSIFGIRRPTFVTEYIAAITGARNAEINPYVNQLIDVIQRRGYEEKSYGPVYELVNRLVLHLDRTHVAPAVTTFPGVWQGFDHILARLRDTHPNTSAEQAALDAKCVEIIKFVLSRPTRRGLGRHAIIAQADDTNE